MGAITPNYGWPYHLLSDPADAEKLGKELALAIEQTLVAQILALQNGYRYVSTTYFTASGSFAKASIPGLRLVTVECVGPGGGGAGAEATGVGQSSGGGGGGGGGWCIEDILAADLGTSETVTVGTGGAGGVGNANGAAGTATSFGTVAFLTANSGGGGNAIGAGTTDAQAVGGTAGSATGGARNISGSSGGTAVRMASAPTVILRLHYGGASAHGWGMSIRPTSASSADGNDGPNFGGGGTGAHNGASQAARPGGDGGDGLVIVHAFA